MHKASVETANNPPTSDAKEEAKQKWSTMMSVKVYGTPYTMHGAVLGHTRREVGGK